MLNFPVSNGKFEHVGSGCLMLSMITISDLKFYDKSHKIYHISTFQFVKKVTKWI